MSVDSEVFVGMSELVSKFDPSCKASRATLYESIVPMYYISKVFGLTCFGKSSINGKVRFRESRVGLVINGLWMIGILALGLTSSFHLRKVNLTFMSSLSVLLSLCNLWSPIVLCICCICGARRQKEIIVCVDNLNSIDEALAGHKIFVPHKKNRRFIIKLIVTSITLLLMLLLFDLSLMFFNSTLFALYMQNLLDCLLIWTGYHLPKLLNLMLECQILVWVLAINQRFELLNKKLDTFTGNRDLVLVKSITGIHADLCHLAKQANATHSLQLLLVVLTHFLNVLITIYSGVLVHVFDMHGDTVHRYKSVALFIAYWLGWYISKIVILCKYCGAIRIDQNQKTGVLVHRALGRTTDPQIQKQLMMFSNQLIHSKVSVTACHFFDVDLKLVASMAGAVATYLIILVSFELARGKGDLLEEAGFFNNTTS